MDGQTTVEEEALLADYFRSSDVPAEWEDYRAMFDYFDHGMEDGNLQVQPHRSSIVTLMGRRWWGIAAAACITAAIVATVVLHQPESTTTVLEKPEIASHEMQQQAAPSVETQDVASLQTTPEQPVETQNLASRSTTVKTSHKRKSTHVDQRRLQAENAKLARENERLQRELADLKRRSFIIDLEANGYKAVQDEDGNIVLIDLEQELENELNNKLTNNIPAL